MKRIYILLLALVLALSCVPALAAEGAASKAMELTVIGPAGVTAA